jgi:DNA-binding IclR family transcriptional regulator
MNIQIELPATVAQVAQQVGKSKTTVYRAIERGFFEVDEKRKPTLIVGGEMMLSKQDWIKGLSPALEALPRGLYGFDETGDLHLVDRRANTAKIARGERRQQLRDAISQIEAWSRRLAA